MASESNKIPPCFSEHKSYDTWVTEVEFWGELTKIPKAQQGIAVALSLPEGSSAREKVFSELTLTDLKADDGLTKLLEFLKKHFKEDGIAGIYAEYAKFDDIHRDKSRTMEKYLDEFDRLQKRMKKIKVQYPDSVLALKLLHRSGLSASDKKLVLTGVDYSQDNTLYDQMKRSLKKFFCSNDMNKSESTAIVVKSEPVMLVNDGHQSTPPSSSLSSQVKDLHVDPNINIHQEIQQGQADVYYANNRMQGRWGSRRGVYRGRSQRIFHAPTGRGRTSYNRDGMQDSPQKKANPLDAYGKPRLCRICGSKYHFAAQCPDNDNIFRTDARSNYREEF